MDTLLDENRMLVCIRTHLCTSTSCPFVWSNIPLCERPNRVETVTKKAENQTMVQQQQEILPRHISFLSCVSDQVKCFSILFQMPKEMECSRRNVSLFVSLLNVFDWANVFLNCTMANFKVNLFIQTSYCDSVVCIAY